VVLPSKSSFHPAAFSAAVSVFNACAFSAVTHSKQDALALGATAYVTKSESAKTVIQTVLELIESRHPVAT